MTIKTIDKFRLAITCALVLSFPSLSFAIEGLPGSTWGHLSHDTDGLTGSGAMGNVNQGIDWTRLSGDILLNTFVEYRYRTRSKLQEYYDAGGPAVGVELKKSFLRLGVDYYWERLPVRDENFQNREFYLSWYYDWRKPMKAVPFEALSGSTWGILTHDMDGLTGDGIMGYINQGIDWTTLPANVVLNTYAEYRYRSRTKQQDYFNTQGPAMGIEFQKSYFKLGMDYYWERYPELGTTSENRQIYLNWYYYWDLKQR